MCGFSSQRGFPLVNYAPSALIIFVIISLVSNNVNWCWIASQAGDSPAGKRSETRPVYSSLLTFFFLSFFFFWPSVRKRVRSAAGQITLHTRTDTNTEIQYKSRQQMWPCSVRIRSRAPSRPVWLFHLINTDYLQLPQAVIPSAPCIETKHTLTNSCRASRDTNILHMRSFQLIPFIPECVSTCTLDYCLSPITLVLSVSHSLLLSPAQSRSISF